jgi:hypothetical protein
MHTASRRVRKTLEPDLDNASEGKLPRTRIASCIRFGLIDDQADVMRYLETS